MSRRGKSAGTGDAARQTGDPPKPSGGARLIVFLGPSLPTDEARRLLDAEYRPPICRGDIDRLPAGSTVAIIDGVFDQARAVSPREIRDGIARGMRIFGSSSMGALRAAEVTGMVGVGLVHRMYETGAIESDDEVAIAFDPESMKPLSEPLVNIRHAVERLVRPGTISADAGERILGAARKLFYTERSYPMILREAGLAGQVDAPMLLSMLRSHDLKREDAITLLEQLKQLTETAAQSPNRSTSVGAPERNAAAQRTLPDQIAYDAPVFFWEFGDRLELSSLVQFLKVTGAFPHYARNAVARFLLEGERLAAPRRIGGPPLREAVRSRAGALRIQWALRFDEEFAVTLEEMGIGADTFRQQVQSAVEAERRLMHLAREESELFLEYLRSELFLDDLALKREAARLGSVRFFAAAETREPPSDAERAEAKGRLCELGDAVDWAGLVTRLGWWGMSPEELEEISEMFARARRQGRQVVRQMGGFDPTPRARADGWPAGSPLGLAASPKVPGDRRFCRRLDQALVETTRLAQVVGVTRVGTITHMHPMGIPNAQAYRPSSTWSSTVGGGKSASEAGAKIGAVMEEVEKWAQEQFDPSAVPGSGAGDRAAMERHGLVLDPGLLSLPFDSSYVAGQSMEWTPVFDLISDRNIYVPSAALTRKRLPGDILFSARLGRKMFDTNGLASGFTLEEAITHAASEVIERHATRLADLEMGNPGTHGRTSFWRIDRATLPASARELTAKIHGADLRLEVFEITSEVRVPTFMAMIQIPVVPWSVGIFGGTVQPAPGWAAHPDPEVAVNSAILEAVQTVLTNVSGAREDLTVRSRSLGRHERTGARTRLGLALQRGVPDVPAKSFSAVEGQENADALDDVRWILDQLTRTGIRHMLVVDLTATEILPARVVRVIIPGLENTNPLHTGARARAHLIRDLLPGC
jgi:ribosomal protein S12 methylthiotransferase accessory factor